MDAIGGLIFISLFTGSIAYIMAFFMFGPTNTRISDRKMRRIRSLVRVDELVYSEVRRRFDEQESGFRTQIVLSTLGEYSERRIYIEKSTEGLDADPLRNQPSSKHQIATLCMDGIGAGWDGPGFCIGLNPKEKQYSSFDELWLDLTGRQPTPSKPSIPIDKPNPTAPRTPIIPDTVEAS